MKDNAFSVSSEITFRPKSTKALETTGDATIEYSISAYLSTGARTCSGEEQKPQINHMGCPKDYSYLLHQ